MKSKLIIPGIVMLLLLTNIARADVSLVYNGSFESDNWATEQTLTDKPPRHWCDANVPAGKFGGYLDTVWSTHGQYALTMYTDWFSSFDIGEMVSVSQQVYLADVNKIMFDIQLGIFQSLDAWDNNFFNAVVQIDGNDVWNSASLGDYPKGEFAVEINDVNVNDTDLHTLTLGIRSSAASGPYGVFFIAYWDAIRFDTHCEGFGYLLEDFSQNCVVDFYDVKLFAEKWLQAAEYPYDLAPDERNTIDAKDYSAFAGKWQQDSYWQPDQLLIADLNNDGIVNLVDYAILVADWGSDKKCIRANIDGKDTVDFMDLDSLAGQWLERNWLYLSEK